jgi:hypothetical protein
MISDPRLLMTDRPISELKWVKMTPNSWSLPTFQLRGRKWRVSLYRENFWYHPSYFRWTYPKSDAYPEVVEHEIRLGPLLIRILMDGPE